MKPVIFIGKTNSACSQIAEGFAKHLGVGSIQVTSAGLKAGEVHSQVIATMNDVGVDISRQTAKALSNFNPEDFDVVIVLCGGDELPSAWTQHERFEDWQIDDPTIRPELFPQVRDEIRLRVIWLIESIDIKQVTQGHSNARAVRTAD